MSREDLVRKSGRARFGRGGEAARGSGARGGGADLSAARPRESGDPVPGPWIPACAGMSELVSMAASQILGRVVPPRPPPETPRRVPMCAGRRFIRYAVDAGRAPWLAARQPRERHPAAGPQPVAVERLVGIFRAGRQVAAVEADQRRERVAIGFDQAASGEAREVRYLHSAAVFSVAAPDGKPAATFPGAAPRLASIWLIASTTASNVSMVEAWRAL